MNLHACGIYDLFRKNANAHGDGEAVVFGAERINFRDLDRQVCALAAGLEQKGLGRGDRIAILSLNTHKFLWVFGAAAALGAIVVPINWRLAENEVRGILEDTSPAFLVTDKAYAGMGASLCAGGDCRLLCFDPDVESAPCIDSLLQSPVRPRNPGQGDDPFCIIHTAAVEGRPRGAVLSHANIVFSNMQGIATMQLGVDDAYLNMLPMFHITGLNLSMAVLHAGGKNVVMEKFDAAQALDLTEREKVTVLGSFPPILTTLEQELAKKPRDVSSLRHVMGIDAPDMIALWQEKTGCVFWVLYGQTETSGLVTCAKSVEAPGSAGRESLLASVRIMAEDGQEAAAGEIGEIVVRGPLVFSGFWEKGAMAAPSFKNGWHHTGDLGRMDAAGFLWFAGRKPEKELIKPGGENVYPAEVENVIMQHPAIREVCVIGVPDPKFGEGVKAVCVVDSPTPPGADAIMEFVAGRIARYKKPRYVSFVESLPKTKSGAIDRAEVKRLHGKA